MRVLLINPQGNYPNKGPSLDMIPQGPAYISGMMIAQGHSVRGVNTSWILSDETAPDALARSIKENIHEFEPQVIAVGGMVAEYLFVRDAIGFVRKLAPDTPILLGGSILTNDRSLFETLRPDFGIMDEGELPIKELLHALETGGSVEKIENVCYWRDGKPVYNKLRNANYGLDELPLPDYDVMEIEKYFQISNQFDNYFHVITQKYPRVLPLSSGRSCPFKCTFCQYSTLDGSRRKYRGRSMQSVVDEISYFHNKYEINILKIYDDLFSVKSDRIYEFCDLLKQSNIKIDWNASMRVGDVTLDLLKAMKDAGCIHIGYGFESADDGVLKSMNKRITASQIQNAIELSEQAGIGVQANFIFGDPKETRESVEKTIYFYKKYGIDHIIHTDYIMPYPGSPIFDVAKAKGLIESNIAYCETLHYRPRYNMTEMSDQEFYKAIDPIIEDKLAGAKFAENVRIGIDTSPKFKSAFFATRVPYAVQCTCPHCSEEQDFVFPMPKRDISVWSERARFFPPHKFYCGSCYKRILISLLSIGGMEESFTKYLMELQSIAASGQSIVIANTVPYEIIDSLKAYGVDFDKLNINRFLQKEHLTQFTSFLDYKCETRTTENVMRNSHLLHVILPHHAAELVLEDLRATGLPENKILTMDTTVVPDAKYLVANGCEDSAELRLVAASA